MEAQVHEAGGEIKNLEVLIDGRVYTLAGSCTEEHLQRISRYLDRKIAEARKTKPITAYNFDLNTLFIIINIVDEMFKKTDEASSLETEKNRYANEIKKLKAEYEDLKTRLTEARRLLDEEKNKPKFKNGTEANEAKK